jgi:hypothetical protein
MLKLSEFTLEPIFDQKIDHEPFGISKKILKFSENFLDSIPLYIFCFGISPRPLTPERKNSKIIGNKKAPLWGLVNAMRRYLC